MERNTDFPEGEFYKRTFTLFALVLLGYLLYLLVSPFFAALTWAVFIAFLLHPAQVWLVGKLRGRENVSALLLTFTTFVILAGPLAALGANLAAQAGDLLKSAQKFAAAHRGSEVSDLANTPVIGPILRWAQETMGVSLNQIEDWAVEAARHVLQFFTSLGGTIVLGAVGTLLAFALTLFFLFFIVRDGHKMLASLRALVPLPPARKDRLFGDMADVTYAVVYGNGATSVVQGTLVGIGFALVGLPSPIVFGVLGFIFALVPMAGTPFVWGPAVMILAIQQRWIAAGFMLVWGIMIALIDNFVTPVLISGRTRLDTFTVFLGVLGGASAFGPIGVIVGPVILALILSVMRFMREANAESVAPEESKTRERKR